jgi:hypothetical protein
MIDPVGRFVDGLASLAAAPARQSDLVIYRIEPVDGRYAGDCLTTAVEVIELANWPIAPPHWIHLPADVGFAHTNSQPSQLSGFARHSRQIAAWGTDPNPDQAWLAHVRSVVGEAQ